MHPDTLDNQVPCSTCGTLTINAGTQKCSACWEVESRLEDYLRRGGRVAQDTVRKVLLTSLARREDTGIEKSLNADGELRFSPIKRWLAEYSKLLTDAHVRPEIQALAERGNITFDEIKELRCNSWEWETLVPALDDEAFAGRLEHALANCGVGRRPFASYNEAVEGMYAPELLRRFKLASIERRNFGDTIDGVREALGQDATHYLVMADDVKELVEAVELCANDGGCRAMTVLRRLRDAGRVRGDVKEGWIINHPCFVPRWQEAVHEVRVLCAGCQYALPATDESGEDGFNVPAVCSHCGKSEWKVVPVT